MIYEYQCRWGCGATDISKVSWRSAFEEECPTCRAMMVKVYYPPQISVGTFRPGYYPTFGKRLQSPFDLKNEIRKLNGEEGKTLIEVGNEHSAMKKLKPPKKRPNLEAAAHELKTKKVNWNA